MARGGLGRGRRWRSWACLSAGVLTVLGLSLPPASPFAAGRWPLGGAFGVFTWAAWGTSTALAVSLFLLGGVLRLRGGVGAVGVGGRSAAAPRRTRRVLWGGVGFSVLAGSAYAAAARADLIERHPFAALMLALSALVALRQVAFAVSPNDRSAEPTPGRGSSNPADGGASGGGADPGAGAGGKPSGPGRSPREVAPPPRRVVPEPEPDSDDETGREADDVAARWSRRLATAMAVFLLLFVIAGTAVRWLGPGLGLVLTLENPAPVFWQESAFFEYEALMRSGGDASNYRRAPAPGSPEEPRRGVLAAGARLAIKGLVEGGFEVRVESDPGGRFTGEWGYVRIEDVTQ